MMRVIRERFLILNLRNVAETIIYNCNLCKRYCKGPLEPPATGNLPKFDSELFQATGKLFQATVTDFNGPLIYKNFD